MWKLLVASVLLLLVILTVNASERLDRVFLIQDPAGAKRIQSEEDASNLCIAQGAELAKSWMLEDAVNLRDYWPCMPCGWMYLGRNYRTRCGNETEAYIRCADVPAEEGAVYALGYDAYCYGESYEVPPDAVPINAGPGNRGYVFRITRGNDEYLDTESLAQSQCMKRSASLATIVQLELAWSNGFSQCECAWIDHYQAQPMNERLLACGNSSSIMGCHFGSLRSAICYMDLENPGVRGLNTVDFTNLVDGQFPLGVEPGSTAITGGYVYPARSVLGNMRTMNLQFAYLTCRNQMATVATKPQVKEAYDNGMHWCKCSYVWAQNDEVILGSLAVGSGRLVYPSKRRNDECGQTLGINECTIDDGEGFDVFCFKSDALKPAPAAWKIPVPSIKIDGGRVYHVEDRDGPYLLTSSWYGNKECGRNNDDKGVLATKEQLQAAVANGLSRCRCGYVQKEGDEEQMYVPMYRPVESCGAKAGLLACPDYFDDVPQDPVGWDAWCFISDEDLASFAA